MQSNNYNRQIIDLKEDERSFTAMSKSTYGYCKIETRGRKCRIKLSINNLVKSNNIYKAHLIKVNENTTEMTPLGVIELDNNNTGQLNISTDSDKIMGTNHSMDDFSIIAITCKENKDKIRFPLIGYIKDVNYPWKKNIGTRRATIQRQQSVEKNSPPVRREKQQTQPINMHKEVKQQQPIKVDKEVREQQAIRGEEERKETTTINVRKETLDKREIKEQVEEKRQQIYNNAHGIKEQQDKYQEEYMPYKDSYNKHDNMNEAYEKQEDDVTAYEAKESIEIDDVENQTFDIIKQHFSKKELAKIHENIFKEYPKMNPFEKQDDNKEWIRIEPADIIYFPMETWMLTNNTFLLNAYRKYKHLILGRDKMSYSEKPYFVLGVPGVYYPKDRVAAYFYGFKEFVTCSGAKTKSGEYGYWIVEIDSSLA